MGDKAGIGFDQGTNNHGKHRKGKNGRREDEEIDFMKKESLID